MPSSRAVLKSGAVSLDGISRSKKLSTSRLILHEPARKERRKRQLGIHDDVAARSLGLAHQRDEALDDLAARFRARNGAHLSRSDRDDPRHWPSHISSRHRPFAQMAGREMAGLGLAHRRPPGFAAIKRIRAAGMKVTAGGRLMGLGTSPCRMMRCGFTVGSGTGTAESSASVYGCCGAANGDSLSASSTIRPRYITATRWLMCTTKFVSNLVDLHTSHSVVSWCQGTRDRQAADVTDTLERIPPPTSCGQLPGRNASWQNGLLAYSER